MNKKNRVLGGWKKCVWGVGILAVSLILIWVVLDIASGIKLRRAIAAWQDAGLPMDFREAIPDPVPEEENAAVILNHVIDFSYPEGREARLTDRGVGRAEEEAIEMGEELFSSLTAGDVPAGLVEDLETALGEPTLAYKRKIARRAVEYERFDAYLEYELGFELLIPHVGEMRRLGQLLQAEAVLHAATDRWPEAYGALLVSVQLSELLADEPLLISRLTRKAIHRRVLERLEGFLQIRPPGNKQSSRLRRTFSEAEKSELLRVIRLEGIVFALYFYRLLEEGGFAPSRFVDSHGLVSYRWLDQGIFRPLHKADIATFMDATRQRFDRLGSRSAGADYHGILSELEKMETDGASGFPFYAFVTRQVFPARMDRVFLNEWEIITRLALARAALGAHAYRAAANDWPRTLEDLVPEYLSEVPEDPFDDGLLRYERGGGRVVLYSIGPDRTDDGGQPMDDVDTDTLGDLVWVLEGESL